MTTITHEETADKLANEIKSGGKPKKIKVRTLLGHFNYEKRTEDNSSRITELLAERNIMLNPSIMKFGETWQLKLDDRVYLLERTESKQELKVESSELEIYDYNNDVWFDDVLTKEFRTEKEVENKFIIPLLNRLGFNENDRYDAMPVTAAHGSKDTILEVDFALFNSENENLKGQVLLVVEAKREERLLKQVELIKAKKQVQSYAFWLGCHYGLVTDSKTIQVYNLLRIRKEEPEKLFDCKREDLKSRFRELYKIASKKSLSDYYETFIK